MSYEERFLETLYRLYYAALAKWRLREMRALAWAILKLDPSVRGPEGSSQGEADPDISHTLNARTHARARPQPDFCDVAKTQPAENERREKDMTENQTVQQHNDQMEEIRAQLVEEIRQEIQEMDLFNLRLISSTVKSLKRG